MPHFHIDYSANLENRLDIAGLLPVLRDAAMETGLFPLAGIRIRATVCTHSLIADGNPDHAFLDISVRLREGRPLDARKNRNRAYFCSCEKLLCRCNEQLFLHAFDGDGGTLTLTLARRPAQLETM